MVKNTSYLFLTGHDVVKQVIGEDISSAKLSGSFVHTTQSGIADLAFENDIAALLEIRQFFNFLPLSNTHLTPYRETNDPADRVNM